MEAPIEQPIKLTPEIKQVKKSSPIFTYILIIIITAIICISATFWFLSFNQKSNTLSEKPLVLSSDMPVVSVSPQLVVASVSPSVSPDKNNGCNFADTSFCPILENVKASLNTKNTQPIYSYLLPQSVTCDPDGMFVPICENAPKGTVKNGIMLGYVQSEGAVYPESQAISIVESYISSTNLVYHGAKQLGDKGVIVYLSQDKLKLLAFPFQKIDGSWKMNYLLMGTATDNYKNLDDTILGN